MAVYSKRRIRALLQAIDEAPTADAKGDLLEELGCYLFCRIPGISFVKKNILDGPRAHELDIAFWNDHRRSQIPFIDAVLIAECKATAIPVGSAAVGWFVRKLQDRGSHNGILVALNGITGNADGVSAAHSEVITALIRDRIKIMILTRDEILTLDSSSSLAAMLKGKFLRLTLDRVVT